MVLDGVQGYLSRTFGGATQPETQGSKPKPRPATNPVAAPGRDVVELSAHAPRPLSAQMLQTSSEIRDHILANTPLSASQERVLRTDRVHAAVVTLGVLMQSGVDQPAWPGGFPAPSSEELQEAYRRLSQRLQDPDAVDDPGAVQDTRLALLDAYRSVDFTTLPLPGIEE